MVGHCRRRTPVPFPESVAVIGHGGWPEIHVFRAGDVNIIVVIVSFVGRNQVGRVGEKFV